MNDDNEGKVLPKLVKENYTDVCIYVCMFVSTCENIHLRNESHIH